MPEMRSDSDPEDAFDRWYRVARPQVLAALVVYCGDLGESAEATDEAFTRAFARWAQVRHMDSPTGWVFVVGRNLLRRQARRDRGERERAGMEAHLYKSAGPDTAGSALAAQEVGVALSALTTRQREVVVLHCGLDISQDEVAHLLGISRSTVATTLMDARAALRAQLKGEAHA